MEIFANRYIKVVWSKLKYMEKSNLKCDSEAKIILVPAVYKTPPSDKDFPREVWVLQLGRTNVMGMLSKEIIIHINRYQSRRFLIKKLFLNTKPSTSLIGMVYMNP